MDVRENDALDVLDSRLRTLLPEEYRDGYEQMEPVPMRSAGLKFDASGQVAWDQIWGSFCDLAMAGGPPHKGALLEAGRETDINADFDRYDEVAEEISRGIRMATGLRAYVSPNPGWVSVTCQGDVMAGWLMRAITMENVAARRQGTVLEVPAAPHFRLEKEIKNVVTVVAKTCHYWLGHIPRDQQLAIGSLFREMAAESRFVEPDYTSPEESARGEALAGAMASRLRETTGLVRSPQRAPGWLGLECASVRSAVWMMRALVTSNVAARREGNVLCVPVNPGIDPRGTIVAAAVERTVRCAVARGLPPA